MTDYNAEEIIVEAIEKDEDWLTTLIFQSLGAASVCWEDMSGAGVFDDRQAKNIGDQLVAALRKHGVPRESTDYAEIYEDEAGEWRYRVYAANHEQIGKAEEGFDTKWNAKRALRRRHPGVGLRETV